MVIRNILFRVFSFLIIDSIGNWNGTAKFKMWFNNGGAIEFGKALMEAGRMASQNRNMNHDYSYNYGQNDNIYAAPPPAYTAPPEYGWVPLNVFPERPAENTVYTHDAPPPYSGIFPTPPRNGNVADAYYNPADPFKAYAASAPPQVRTAERKGSKTFCNTIYDF